MKNSCTPRNRHRRFACLLGLLLLMIMTRYAFQVDLPRVIFLVVITMIVLLGDQDEIVAMIICCIPLHESIDFFYALVICTAVYVCKYFRQIRVGSSVFVVFACIIWELLHCFRSTFSPVTFIGNMIPFIILAVLMASPCERLDYAFVVRMFALVTLSVSIILFMRVLFFANFNISMAIAGLQRLGSDRHSSIVNVKVSGGQINPNTLGIVTVLASTGLMQLRSMGAGTRRDLVLMCAMIVFAALGTSRTFLICLVLMVVLLILSEQGGILKKAKVFAMLTLAAVVTVIATAVLFTDTFEFYVSRFFVQDITTGRDVLMMQYHDYIINNPKVMAFGIGLQDFGDRLIFVYRVAQNAPHNSVQELIIAWGIPGLFLFISLFLNIFSDAFQHNPKGILLNSIPMIIIIFKGMAGQMLYSSYTMLAFSFAYLSLCADMTRRVGAK